MSLGRLIFGLMGFSDSRCLQDIIEKLECCPILNILLPWGKLAITQSQHPTESDDGPIFWVRPGEQMIRTDEVMRDENGHKIGKRRNSGPQNGSGGAPKRSSFSIRNIERREVLFEDRTPCHADHVGDGLERHTTAAVGILQAIRGPHEKR